MCGQHSAVLYTCLHRLLSQYNINLESCSFFACFRFLIFHPFFPGGSADPICPYVRTPMPGYDQVDWLDAAGVCFHQSQLDLGHESFINPVVKLWHSGCISQLPRFLAQLVKILCQISPKFWPQITKLPGLSTCLHLLFFYLCLFYFHFVRCQLTGLIASAGGDDCIQIFAEDKSSGDDDQPSFKAAAKADTFEVNGLSWNPCVAGLLASCSEDGCVILWNVTGCSLS